MRNKWKARGPNSSKKTDVLESSQDIVHQSAMSLVPEVLYPEMGINEVEQAAARQVRAGCHDVDTVNDPGLPDRTQDSWVKLHCALLKKRLIKALSIDSDLRANSLAEEDKAQAKVANLEAKEERTVANTYGWGNARAAPRSHGCDPGCCHDPSRKQYRSSIGLFA